MTRQFFISTLSAILLCTGFLITHAQTPTDAIMMAKGDLCIGLFYEHGTWDEYWEGDRLITNGNVGTLTRTSLSAGIALGLFNRVNLLVGLPYISTKSDGGQLKGVSGLQDLSLGLKANLIEKELGPGTVYFLTTGEFSTPVSNYLSDYAPYSIGLHTNQAVLRGIFQYKLDIGPYVRGAVAHLWRGTSQIERDYYYNNGSYYTDVMDVPNAWNYQAVAGVWLLKNQLQIEGQYTVLNCVEGDDIRAWNAGQPTNKVEVAQVGGHIRYEFSKPFGLGAILGYSTILEGRNMGKFSTINAGIFYQFKVY